MRDTLMMRAYFDTSNSFLIHSIQHRKDELKKPTVAPSYEPQFCFELVRDYWALMISSYSSGAEVEEIAKLFLPSIEWWEFAREKELATYSPERMNTRTNFEVNLSHYIDCFWLVGMALAFDLEESLWQRLLKLIGNEGRDVLFDKIVATRQPGRLIGNKLLYPKPYQPLLLAIESASPKREAALRKFVEGWYAGLQRGVRDRPYWWDCHLGKEGGGYFGYWCIEAVAAVKAFGIDDAGVCDLPHYPKDMLSRQASR